MRKLILDMDGVFVDFTGGLFKRHGWTRPKGLLWVQANHKGHQDVFATCDYDFWADLDWTPQGRELVQGFLRDFGARNIYTFTSPLWENLRGCYDGKRAWLAKHVPELLENYIPASVKHIAAGPNALLVDDRHENLNAFLDHGGNVMPMPQSWNDYAVFHDEDERYTVEHWLEAARLWRESGIARLPYVLGADATKRFPASRPATW